MEEVLRCPKCNSTQTRFRFRTEDRICYFCGNIWSAKEKEDID